MRYWILFGLFLCSPLWAQPIAHYHDQRNVYAGLSAMMFTVDYGSGDTVNPGGLGFRLGGMLDSHWGMELRAGVAPIKSTLSLGADRSADVTLDHAAALLLTGRLPFRSPMPLPMIKDLFVQGFAGLADAQVKSDRHWCSASRCRSDVERNNDTTPAWGVGAGLRTDFNVGLTLQYMHYISQSYIDISGYEAGIEWYF
ncbi:MAG: outer membrane beta-barrel protein [Alcanivorax sp.]|nr:outer membrane beta-barrel protein [Alcanivorax sp.]